MFTSDTGFWEVLADANTSADLEEGESHFEQLRRLRGGRYFVFTRCWTEYSNPDFDNGREISRAEALLWCMNNNFTPPRHVQDELNPISVNDQTASVLPGTPEPSPAPVAETCDPASEIGQEPPEANDSKSPTRRKNIHARMLALLFSDNSCVDWTAEEFAEKLDCSKTSVINAAAWGQIIAARATRQAERVSRTGALDGGKNSRRG